MQSYSKMKLLLLILVCLSSASSVCQIPDADKKKIQRILGADFLEQPTQKSYLPYFECRECTPDTSMVFVNKNDGAIKNNEFILHHDAISFVNGMEAAKFMRSSYVTTAEYNEFESWVRDSMAMENIYNGQDIPYYNFPFIIRDRKIQYYENGIPVKTPYAYRGDVRKDITFDRSYRLDYSDHSYVPLLADMYLPQPMRFMRVKEFNKSRFSYKYLDNYEKFKNCSKDTITAYFTPPYEDSYFRNERDRSIIENEVPVMRSEYEFAKRSQHLRDEYGVLGILGAKTLEQNPAFGLKGFQADAFCHWKAEQLQTEFNKHNLKYKVIVTLPTADDSEQHVLPAAKVHVPAKDYSAHWRISNAEYTAFMASVRDSVIREHLFLKLKNHEEAIQFINFTKYYFDEGALEYVAFDQQEKRAFLREIFSLNLRTKIKKMTPEMDSIINSLSSKLTYECFEIDAKARSMDSTYELGVWNDYGDVNWLNKEIWGNPVFMDNGEPIGKENRVGDRNILGEPAAIRTHVNLQRFYKRVEIDITPSNGTNLPEDDAFVQPISYEQAHAFYNWKFPIHKYKEGDNWQDFVYPSKEQFLTVQSGEAIVVDAKTIEYTSPSFRYVVHLFAQERFH